MLTFQPAFQQIQYSATKCVACLKLSWMFC